MATNFEKGKPLSVLTNKTLKEASGLESSIRNPDLLWTHNDSGNEASIFLIDEDLDIKMTVTLAGIENRDWEDITVGPGPDSSQTYVYVGDIGDNDAIYPYKYIYRFPEPVFSTTDHVQITEFDTIIFKLEGAVKDTESLFIDANTRNLYVVSKREEPVFLYMLKYPQVNGDTLIASNVLSLPFKEIVSADMSPDGDILMKNYTTIYYWENKNNEDLISLLNRRPGEIPYEEEPQGEAIAWATRKPGFYTFSEKKKKKPSYLYFYAKKP
ncbi:MAG TPA: hypothetical protein VD884_21175 [Ohtaekwangia sp.]|nr:hypothetical protein [Ohtaekwangia sp.]